MRVSIKHRLLLLMAALVLIAPLACAAAPQEATANDLTLTCEVVPMLTERYHAEHVVHDAPDEHLIDRMTELMSDRLDPSKSLLTAAEAEAVERQVRAAIEAALKGDCVALEALNAQRVTWHEEMEAFARQTLADEDLEIDRSVELELDPDDRELPVDEGALAELRRKLIHFQLANYVVAGTPLDEARELLTHRYELITRRAKERTSDDLHAELLNAFANALDPHSTYFSAEDLEDFRISMDLSLEGIGAVLTSKDGYTTVQEIMAGGAADRDGELKAKDRIIAVGQGAGGEPTNVIDMDLRDVVRLIRGERGTEVRLIVLRDGERTETLEIVITRDKIDLAEQAAKLEWQTVADPEGGDDLKIAVLSLPSFYGGDANAGARDAVADVRALLEEVNAQGADGLMLDLSRNGGGLLQAAVEISGFFIAEGPVVSVDGPDMADRVLTDNDEAIIYNGPLVVLTSRVSASASEILAGALKDYHRAVIVGDDQTFGKGSVQNILPLPQGLGALKVTTGRFYRPGGASTQNSGVAADVVIPSIFSGEEIGEQFQPYALPPSAKDSFLGDAVNVSEADAAWTPVSTEEILEIKRRSGTRVAGDEAFKELREQIAERAARGSTVRLAELLEDGDGDAAEEEEEEEALTPQAKEAIHILADLIALR